MSDASDEQARIYLERAEEYDALIAAEDADGALLRELERRAPFDGKDVLDVGAGTGRIARLVARRARHTVLVERAGPMLAIARRHLDALGAGYTAHEGDARALPVGNASADVAIAAWVFGHFRYWMPAGWREEVGAAIEEMRRAVRPGGTIVIIETLGTGHTEPRKSEALDEYFTELERRWGFERTWIRTDYAFPSVAEAVRVCGPFFGPELAARIESERWERVPECTAVFVAARSN